MGVLGAIIHNNDAMFQVRGRVTPAMFYAVQHRLIYIAMLELTDRQDPLDEITIASALKAKGRLAEIPGGVMYFAELVDIVPVTANVLVYAEIIEKCWSDRTRMELAGQLQEAKGDVQVAEDVRQGIQELAEHESAMVSQTVADAAATISERMQAIDRQEITPVLTYTKLDSWLFGLEPGFCSFIGARPGGGKTTLLLQIALGNIMRGAPVLFISMELKHWQLVARMACNLAAVDGMKVLKDPSQLSDQEWDRWQGELGRLTEKPLHLVGDGKRLTLQQIEYHCRFHHDNHGVRLVVIDHLRKIQPPLKGSTYDVQSARAEGLSEIASNLDRAALLVAAQVNRKGAEKPSLGDLEGSGVIEQEADAVVLLTPHPAGKDEMGAIRRAYIDAELAKVRNGKTGPMHLNWEPEFFRMGADDYQERMV